MGLKSYIEAVHLLAAVVWVGGIFFMQVVMRRITAAMDPKERQALMVRTFEIFFLWVWGAVAVILATGFGIIYGIYGGFSMLPFSAFRHIYVMVAIGTTMIVVFFYIYFGPFRELKAARAAGDMKRAASRIQLIRSFGSVNLALGVALVLLVKILR